MKQKNPYFATLFLIFIVVKILYKSADNAALRFLLTPTNAIVQLLSGAKSSYSPQRGFYYANFNIVIEKSCSGFNFWILCYMMLSFSAVFFFNNHRKQLLAIVSLLPITWLLTVFVNASRIIVALTISRLFPQSTAHYPWLHQAEGIGIYLSFLLLFYSGFQLIITKITVKNA